MTIIKQIKKIIPLNLKTYTSTSYYTIKAITKNKKPNDNGNIDDQPKDIN